MKKQSNRNGFLSRIIALLLVLSFALMLPACSLFDSDDRDKGDDGKTEQPNDTDEPDDSDKPDDPENPDDSIIDDEPDPIVLTKYVQQTEIPTLEITTSQEIASKYEYVDASYKMVSESGEYDFEVDGQIRLRGNYSMTLDKKPYRLKFASKLSPIGMDNSKSWYLLNEMTDFSMLRNYLGYTYADDLMDYSLRARYVQVKVNDDYKGIYLMTDKKGEDKDRIPITLTTDSATGWIVELDNRAIGGDNPANETPYQYCINEGIEFNKNAFYVQFPTGDMQAFVISEPEEPTKDQFDAIKDYVTRTVNSLSGTSYDNYIDIDSMAKYYMVEELWHNTDVGSVYLYRETGSSKVKFGPVWDLDLSCGISGISLSEGKENVYNEWYFNTINVFFQSVYNWSASKQKFLQALKTNWNAAYAKETADLLQGIDDTIEFLSDYQQLNFARWDTIGKGVYVDGKLSAPAFMKESYLAMTTWQQHTEAVREFLTLRAEWMNTQINA